MEKEHKEAENAPGYSQELQAKMVGCSQFMSEWTQLQPIKQTEFFGYSQHCEKKGSENQLEKSDINRPKTHSKSILDLLGILGARVMLLEEWVSMD